MQEGPGVLGGPHPSGKRNPDPSRDGKPLAPPRVHGSSQAPGPSLFPPGVEPVPSRWHTLFPPPPQRENAREQSKSGEAGTTGKGYQERNGWGQNTHAIWRGRWRVRMGGGARKKVRAEAGEEVPRRGAAPERGASRRFWSRRSRRG